MMTFWTKDICKLLPSATTTFFLVSVGFTETGLHLITHVITYVFVTLSILQSQFSEEDFKKAENSEQNVVLLLFLFTLDDRFL